MRDTPCTLAHAPCPGQPGHMCSRAAVLGKQGPRGLVSRVHHNLLSSTGCTLGTPPRPQWAGLTRGPSRGPKIAVSQAWGWHAEHMRDRACQGVGPVCAGPASELGTFLLAGERLRRWVLQGSTLCLLQVEARCSLQATAVGQAPPSVCTPQGQAYGVRGVGGSLSAWAMVVL